MSLNLNGNVTGIYLGSAKADAVYLGNVKVFEDTPPQEFVTIGGRAYPVVTIGTQKWMAENLDWKFDGLTVGATGNSSASTSKANYYNNDETSYGVNGNKAGLLYNGTAAKYIETNKLTLLPFGWRVPSKTDFETLATYAGGADIAGLKLKSTSGWNSGETGTDDFSFNLIPSGIYSAQYNTHGSYSGHIFKWNTSYTALWSSTAYSNQTDVYYFAQVYGSNDRLDLTSAANILNEIPIRLVKDA